MIKKNYKDVGFVYKGTQVIDKIYKGTDLVFEQGYTREQTGVPPITTTYQAIGKNLKDYKIYGNSIQGKLPSEYQQVEYIESSGTQYIDTGYKYVANDKIEIEIMPLEENVDRSIFGAYEMTSTLCELGYRNNLLRGNIAETNSPTYTINQKYKVQLVNGTWQYNNSDFGQTRNNNVSINCYLFARNNNGSVNKQSKEKVYYLKITRNNNIIYDFVPCYRKLDNKPGMYDIVNDVFYTNDGTGEFTVGANVPTPSTPIEIESVGDLITDTNDINYGKYKIPVIAKSKNLFDDTTLSNKWVNVSGSVVDLPKANCKRFECVEGETYTLSASYEIKNASNIIVMAFYDSNDTLLIRNAVSNLEYEELIKTAPQNSKYFYAGYYTIEPQTIQLEKSDIATEYEPYATPVTTNIYLDEPLRKIGNYADYLDFKNQKVFRNVIVNDDTGTQTIENSYTGTTDSSGTSISLPNIPTIKGTTVFEIDTEIQPSSMYIKYKGK